MTDSCTEINGLQASNFELTVKEIFNPKVATFGHATVTENKAKEILSKGIYVRNSEIGSTMWEFVKTHVPMEEQMGDLVDIIKNWTYMSGKLRYLVVAQLPLPNTDMVSTGNEQLKMNKYFNSFLEQLEHPHEIDGKIFNYKLPSQYIRGYIDTQSGLFIPNLDYRKAS